MTLSPMELDILNEHSDDDYATWECIWGMRSRHPEPTNKDRVTICQQTIRSLFEKDLIELYTAIRLGDAYTPLQLLPDAEFDAALDNPKHWHAPEFDGEEVVFFTISSEGLRVLGQEIERLRESETGEKTQDS